MKDYKTWQEEIAAFAARMQSYGVNVTYQPDKPQPEVCPDCNNLGVVKADLSHIPHNERHLHPAFGKLFPCPNARCEKGQETRARRDDARLKNAGLPPEYQQLTFDSWDRLDKFYKAQKWTAWAACKVLADYGTVNLYELHSIVTSGRLDGWGKICEQLNLPADNGHYEEREQLVLYGVPNMGKTGLAASVVNARRAVGKDALYIRCYDIFAEINRRQNAEEYPRSEDILDTFKNAPFLVVDEANIKGETESRLDRFEAIIRHRAAHHKPTLLTCNYSPREFEAAWGLQTFSILSRQGYWIPMAGAPLRAEMAALR